MLIGFSNEPKKFTFTPIQLDANLLGQAYAINSFIKAGTDLAIPIDPRKYPSARSPDIIAPWQLDSGQKSLARSINEVRGLNKFIDNHPRSKHVQLAGSDNTSRGLFVLYKALDNLQTLAQYASEKSTPDFSLARLSEKFSSGLKEVEDFISELELDKLELFFGEKNSSLSSEAGIGKNKASFTGPIIQTGSSDDPISGIVGNEVFDITISNSGGSSDTIEIDLSNITGDVSVNSLVDYINLQIEAVGTYQTRFEVHKNDDFDYGLAISGSTLEQVKFTPQNADPALYVVSNVTGRNDDFETGTLTKIIDIDSASQSHETPIEIAGLDAAATEIAEKTADLAAIDQNETNDQFDIAIDELEPVEAGNVYSETTVRATAADSEGFIYVLGETKGSFNQAISGATESDVFLNKMDSEGNIVYSRMLGAGVDATAYSLTIDSSDNVIISGQTNSDLTNLDAIEGKDAFVTKYDNRGNEIFTYQLDRSSDSIARSIAVDSSGDIYVGGLTKGAISDTSGFGGGWDNLLLKLNGTTGALESSAVIGTSGIEEVRAVSIADDGDLLVVTDEDGSAILKKIDATDFTNEIFSQNLGDLQGGNITDIHTEGTEVYITGYTENAALDAGSGSIANAHSGNADGFIMKLNDAGASISAEYTTYLGGTGTDIINDITYKNGNLYVAGESLGDVNGESSFGLTDSFTSSIDAATGAINYTTQFGEMLGHSQAVGVAYVDSGTSFLSKLGLPVGTVQQTETRDLTTQTSLREGDHFFVEINGRGRRKVSIKDGDDIDDLVRSIKKVSFTFIEPSSYTSDYGPALKIKAINGASLKLFSGNEGQDALSKLGLEPGKIISSEVIANIDPDPNVLDEFDLGGVFGLKLSNNMNLSDKSSAKYSLAQLDTAISTIQRAYRSLVISPTAIDALEKARFKGSAPAHITAKIANFQEALSRLQSSSLGGGGGFLI